MSKMSTGLRKAGGSEGNCDDMTAVVDVSNNHSVAVVMLTVAVSGLREKRSINRGGLATDNRTKPDMKPDFFYFDHHLRSLQGRFLLSSFLLPYSITPVSP